MQLQKVLGQYRNVLDAVTQRWDADRDDVLAGRLPMTGELLTFRLRDLESFAVLP